VKIFPLIKILRPTQWLKNLMLFFPPFLAGVLLQETIFLRGILPFAAFCFASSSSYIFNDIGDIERDRAHPDKMHRPIASGIIALKPAAILAVILLLVSLILASSLSVRLLLYLVAYLSISLAYSLFLKNYPIIDLFCISSGFLLRLMAGGEVFDVAVSEWLFLCVFLLSIFLSTGKRLAEKSIISDSVEGHRKVLSAYPEGFLDGLLYMTGSAVLVAYSIYVVNRHSLFLLYTVPLCAFGLFRYIFRVKSGKGGDPTESLTRDLPLLVVGLLWVIILGLGIYVR
jgi:decaprenyl-phosphate phosphoribosyltransferase